MYTLSKTKTIRKNLFSAKAGKFTASAAQPAPVQLELDGYRASETAVTVSLAFQPSSAEVNPPKVNAVSAKIVSSTFYSASPMTRLPDHVLRNDLPTYSQLAYTTSVPVFNTAVDKVTWRAQTAAVRRDSGYSTDHPEVDERRSKKADPPAYHTAALHIPFKIPVSRKLFLPTFHSCIVSRVYTLRLTLSVGSGNTSVSLDLPIQMTVAPSEHQEPHGGLPSFESVLAEQEAADADAHLQPRLMQVPAPELQQNSVLPGYDDLDMRRPITRTTLSSNHIGVFV